MRHGRRYLPLLLAVLAVLPACSGDDAALPDFTAETTINATLGTGAAGFTVVVDAATTPIRPVRGPFVLRGTNVRYDDGDGVLLVDLTVANEGDGTYAEPVTLTFTRLLPDGVTLWNPPGGGQTYEFGFANDDAMWTPGEESLPLTVAFLVESGTSVAFAAEIGIGFGPRDGVISGTVFEDLDGDGIRDGNEGGLAGVTVDLAHDILEFRGRATTGPDGAYAFPDLPAGAYTVSLAPQPLVAPTGDPVLHVVLVEGSDGVSGFDGADFGALIAPVDFLTVFAAADAMIRADLTSRLNDNHGADPFLGVGSGREGATQPDRIRSLIRFDVPPADSTLVSAHLELTIAAFRDGANQTYRLVVNPVVPSGDRTPWQEGNGSEVTPLPDGVVWVDAADGVAWIGAGDGGDANNQSQPDFAPTAAAELELVQADHAAGDVVSFEVTELVRGWMSGAVPNHGLVLRDVGPAGSFRQVWFGARDGQLRGYTDPRVQTGPRLVLNYE